MESAAAVQGSAITRRFGEVAAPGRAEPDVTAGQIRSVQIHSVQIHRVQIRRIQIHRVADFIACRRLHPSLAARPEPAGRERTRSWQFDGNVDLLSPR